MRQRDETLNKLLLLTTQKREANAQDPYTAVRDIDEYYERYTQLITTLMELARVLQEEEHIIKRPIQWFVALDMPDQFVSAIVPSAAMEMKKFLWGEGGVRQGGCIVVGSMDADIVNHFYPGMLMIYEALKAPDLEDQIEETEPMEVEEQEEHEEEAQPVSHYANTDELELDIMEAQTYQEQ
jgi:hypothetical protein